MFYYKSCIFTLKLSKNMRCKLFFSFSSYFCFLFALKIAKVTELIPVEEKIVRKANGVLNLRGWVSAVFGTGIKTDDQGVVFLFGPLQNLGNLGMHPLIDK